MNKQFSWKAENQIVTKTSRLNGILKRYFDPKGRYQKVPTDIVTYSHIYLHCANSTVFKEDRLALDKGMLDYLISTEVQGALDRGLLTVAEPGPRGGPRFRATAALKEQINNG